ncbi:MAG: 2-oxoacid:acceptor oxidoreductase subunit alpha [Gammaproteobacteria bacterium]|nr:2-oxoacid:acceptor oxidoreductase subunit alpha [Gammaproteobacteria bacterium]
MTDSNELKRDSIEIEGAVIRFAGDSGDGIQVTGSLFTHESALLGHDVSTLPDFPAEIRAPVGTLPGVSSFQLNFSSYDIHTPGDQPDVLVALNPAALKVNLDELAPGGTIILNSDSFDAADLAKAGYTVDPREDLTLSGFQVYPIPISSLTVNAVAPSGLGIKQASLCKNMFTLGIVSWLYDRTIDAIIAFIDKRYGSSRPEMAAANKLALQAGYNYAETVEMFTGKFHVSAANLPPGTYRRITGNEATAMGVLAAAELSGRPLFYASYPITPASDILHELSKLRHFGVRTVQAEDEIAAMGIAIGAAYGGALGLTGTSGPGMALKAEAIGLAVMAELPVVVLNVQRGGPSTGLPTKTEQADLLQAMFGRNGESPLAVVAPSGPADCFYMAIEAFRLAIKYMTPVIYLSDGYIANGSEPWRLPTTEELPVIDVKFHTDVERPLPYARDPETLARPWIIPGTPGLEHRIGGLEKEDGTGAVSYDSENHQKMVHLRAEKIQRIANDIPLLEVHGPEQRDLLVLGWGSTSGAIRQAVDRASKRGLSIAATHLRYINPWPRNLGAVLRNYRHVLVPELNSGQLRLLLRAEFLIDIIGLNKVKGRPFLTTEIEAKIDEILTGQGTRQQKRKGRQQLASR